MDVTPIIDPLNDAQREAVTAPDQPLQIEPGKAGEVIWKFAKAGSLEFACNVPGHYAVKMISKFHAK